MDPQNRIMVWAERRSADALVYAGARSSVPYAVLAKDDGREVDGTG